MMKGKFLECVIYDESGWHHRAEERILEPASAFEHIAAALRRLDQFRYPMVTIRLGEYTDTDYLSITGGLGVYFIEIEQDGRFIDYIDLARGEDRVTLWTSDQGFSCEERFVNRDLRQVIMIAQDYALEGEPSRQVNWLLRT